MNSELLCGRHVPALPRTALGVILLLAMAADLHADALVVTKAMTASTIAEIFVEDSEIRVEIEIGEQDQRTLLTLLPPESPDENHLLPERWATWLRDRFVIREEEGEALEAELADISLGFRLERDQVTGEPLAEQPAERQQVIRVTLRYPLDSQPQTLNISPPLKENTSGSYLNIGFITYHNGLPINDFRYLGAKVTLDLDWNDPWYSRFRHFNLKRQYDSPLSVFLYVEPFEVRKEIILRPRDLQDWIDLELISDQVISVDQQESIKKKAADFLATHGEVRIDGNIVEGRLDRIHFIHRSLRTTGIIEPAVDLDLNAATLGVIFVYPIDALPDEVTLEWDLFSSKILSLPGIATDEAGGLPAKISPEDPILTWTNYLTNPTIPKMIEIAPPPQRQTFSVPLVSVFCGLFLIVAIFVLSRQRSKRETGSRLAISCCLGAVVLGVLSFPYARVTFADPFEEVPTLSEAENAEILSSLLHNIYRSFDHHDDSLIYDRLEKSISGDLLAEVYLETRKSMEVKNQGGLRISVKEVSVEELETIDDQPGAPTFRCRWRVSGDIGHWGHIHRRENEHVALMTLGEREGTWKIIALDLLDEQALEAPNVPETNRESDGA